MRNLAFILILLSNTVNAFVVQGPRNSLRLDHTRISASATVSAPSNVVAPMETNLGAPRPDIIGLDSVEDYIDFLEEDERLCIIKFHAPHCKACQKFGMQYKRIGKEVGDMISRTRDGSEVLVQEGEIRMAEMEYGANKELCKNLGIKKLPSVHIYSKGKLVNGFPCAPSKIGMLLERLEEYRDMSHAELEFEADMNQGVVLGESVLESLGLSSSKESTMLN